MTIEASRLEGSSGEAPDSGSDLIDLLRTMWRARAFEEKVSELYAKGRIGGLLHLGIGQEGSSVGACSVLRRSDYVFGGHRAHAQVLAKGAGIDALFAELAGRATGLCRGKGGSMHVAAIDVGFVTATGVVGGCIPLALGGGLVARERGEGQVAAVFFGDGAGQTGVFHESLNLAALWKLPVIFVCENNGYAEFTPLSSHTLVDRLANYARTFGMENSIVDGNDVLAVRRAMSASVERARAGEGPSFVECITYRMRGHYEGDGSKYREQSEQADWKAKCPIARFERWLAENGTLTEEESALIQRAARDEVAKAAEAALAAPWPSSEELHANVFAGA